jgi:predicted RNA-binding Zn-ribbon protein involved in translation (DUF1610 family)
MTSISARRSGAVIFVCPKCGSDGIYELALCVVIHRVRRWSRTGTPIEYEAPEVDWESDMPYDSLAGFSREKTGVTFECANCMEQFEHPARRA